MQQFHTISQAARMLGITEKTLRQWAARAKITFERGQPDHREKLITHTDLEQLATLHGLPLDHEAVMRDTSLEARITKIEQRLATLEASIREHGTLLEALSTSRPLDIPLTQTKPLARAPMPQPHVHSGQGLPEGLEIATAYATRHGIPATTINKAILSGRLEAVIGQWVVGRATVHKALDQAGQEQFFKLYPQAITCDDPSCACQTRASF